MLRIAPPIVVDGAFCLRCGGRQVLQPTHRLIRRGERGIKKLRATLKATRSGYKCPINQHNKGIHTTNPILPTRCPTTRLANLGLGRNIYILTFLVKWVHLRTHQKSGANSLQ